MKTWSDITLKKFNQIQSILNIQDEYTVMNLIDAIYNIDSAELTLNELSKYNNALSFLNEDIPSVELKKQYTINGHTYNSSIDLTTVTTSQFIDYQNYTKKEEVKYEDILSVFFIPVDHKYNDGYSISEVQTDLLELDMPTVKSIAFFMNKQFQLFVTLFQFYLTQAVQKMKMPANQKKQLLDKINQQDLSSLELFHISQSIAKRQ